MIEIPVYNLDGKQASSLSIDEATLGGEVRLALLKQAYVAMHANQRQGTAATKGRDQVEGSTRKLYKQKGTGRARRGPVRTNIMRGGGVAFRKSAKSWRQDLPIKMRRLANRNALLSKILDGEIKVISKFGFEAPQTKQMVAVMSALSIDRKCLLAIAPTDRNTQLSARNIPDITTIQMEQINVFDLLNHRFLMVEQGVLQAYLDGLKATSNKQATAEKEAA
jgi:large subunit ribosomal protein L4